jgi:hypothetical protein
MAEPTLDQRTPICRLKYEADDARNYNWSKIDDIIGRAFTPGSPLQLPLLSAIRGVWLGTAIGTSIPFSGTPVQLASVATDVASGNNLVNPTVSEDPNRWSIIIAQVTVTVGFGAPGGAPIADLSLALHRGTTSVHTRELFWNATTMGTVSALGRDIPVTLLLVGKPGLGAGDVSNVWSVWGSGSISGGAIASSSSAQVYTVQFT